MANPHLYQSIVTISALCCISALSVTSCRNRKLPSTPPHSSGAKQPISSSPKKKKSASSSGSNPGYSSPSSQVSQPKPATPVVIETIALPEYSPPQPKVEEIVVIEDDANRIISSDGHDVKIAGSDGLVLVTGRIRKLTVSGSNNQIQIDESESIKVTGSDNNLIIGSLGGGTVGGARNKVSWEKGINGLDPVVDSFGQENDLRVLE